MRRGKSGLGRKCGSAPKASPQQKLQAPVGRTHMASQSAPADPAIVEEDRFQALIQAIFSYKTTLMAKIDLLQTDFGLIRRDMNKYRDRLGEAQRHVEDSEDSIRDGGTIVPLYTPFK